VIVWNLGPAKSRTSGDGKFGNLSEVWFGSHEQGNSRTSEKQSQRYRLRKSGLRVWTSGRLVNVWDEKDIHVCVHIRNIRWARGCFRNVKVPSSPYKRGREGARARVNGFTTLEAQAFCGRFLVSPRVVTVFERGHCAFSLVFGDHIRIFGYPPQRTRRCRGVQVGDDTELGMISGGHRSAAATAGASERVAAGPKACWAA
jgi:hypothetical protein